MNSQSACPALSMCTNTIGSFQCHCQDGYTLISHSETGLLFCMDINECQDMAYDCHINATCINTPGAYQCVCLETEGFRGNGTVCIGKFI